MAQHEKESAAGMTGACAAFSFYPAKNLGAMGDAGALVTNDPALAEHVRALREHGQRMKYHHDVEGYTARLDTLQALVLKHKLALLDAVEPGTAGDRRVLRNGPARRRRSAAAARSARKRTRVASLRRSNRRSRASWRPSSRSGGIATGRHYPQPVHLSPAYARLGYVRGDFPVTEALAERGPVAPDLSGDDRGQVEAVVARVRAYFDHG